MEKKKIIYRITIHILAIITFSYSIFTAIHGIEVGRHWDEVAILDQVQVMIDNGNLLPGRYTYSSIAYLLPVLPLIPDIPKILNSPEISKLQGTEKAHAVQEKLREIVKYDPDPSSKSKSHDFLIQSRIIYIIITYLTIFWIYITVLVWRNNPIEALLASMIFALSWEINYHSRWIMPDAIMMQFASLSMMFLILSIKKKIRAYLFLSAIAAGFAVGSKYNSGLLLASILIVPFIWKENDQFLVLKTKISFLFLILLSFSIAYFFTTPGTLFDPVRFIVDFHEVMTHYGEKGHEGYTVQSPLEHLARLIVFFSSTALSHHIIISIILFTLGMIGIYSLIKDDQFSVWLTFLAFPIIYFLFHSTQKVMFVRNIIVLIPFLSIFTARGIIYLQNRYLKQSSYNFILIIITVIILSSNAFWLYHASDTIANPTNPIDNLTNYITEHPDTNFYVTKSVYRKIAKNKKLLTNNVFTKKGANIDKAVFNSLNVHYYGKRSELPSNRHNYYVWFGPREINFNYYSTWRGEEMLVISPYSTFLKLRLKEK